MKIEHRFSFFIFQLSEKMNDPTIHALKRNVKNYAKIFDLGVVEN